MASERMPRRGLLISAGVLVAVLASVSRLDLVTAFAEGSDSLGELLGFLRRFAAPDTSPAFLAKVGQGAIETLAISLIGTLLAVIGGVLLALPASGRLGRPGQAAARFCLNLLRSVPELVWATLTVLAAGLGPFAGTLALALHTTGVLGRLYAEALENAPAAPEAALRGAGSGAVAAFLYGTLPAVSPQWVAYGLYRWEMNIRMAAILGFVGAGGLGAQLYYALSLFQEAQAATLIVAMLGLSLVVDAISGWLRRHLVVA
ncbi:phosphonate ABC transporter, permease protein PhnE [Denitromonas iodatirespirans]|uniref:Phosphonate ABC transporter, permease protein PhnE n=1 Tax=Denitromonas iodatirespirans TaxID=2795389 RepID=A0A944D5T3_DENI1|nr:phosphonate ABC transporter, permease protein PhnE [Denitromonas iodatirespirans]MBT0960395.1 phosphonate ABC transporter, permease protein PhnE [Denitromonas iodatirespirans]